MSDRKKLVISIVVVIVALIGFILAIVNINWYNNKTGKPLKEESKSEEDDKLVSNKVPLLKDGTSSNSFSEEDNSTTYQNGLSKFDLTDEALNGKQLEVFTQTKNLEQIQEYRDIAEKDKEIVEKKKQIKQDYSLFKEYYINTDTSIMDSDTVSQIKTAKSYIENEMMNFSYANEQYCGLAEALDSLLADNEEIADDSVYSCRKMQIEVSDNLDKLSTEITNGLDIYR